MIHIPRLRVLFSLAMILALALAGCGDTAPTAEQIEPVKDNSEFIKEHFEKGNEFAKAEDFESAIGEFEAVLEVDPDNDSARSNLGVVYYNLGRLDEAMEQYQKAIEVAPEDADLHSNLAAAYVQLNQLDKALEEYQTAVNLDSKLAEAYYGLGVVYMQLGKIEEAIGAFEKFQELGTSKDQRARDMVEQYLQQLRGQ